MPLFTKTLKLKAFTKNRFGRYLLYALGEVILVVLGILIALNINNLNEENKQKKALDAILENVSYDLKTDTTIIAQAIKYYDARQKISDDILDDQYKLDELRKCYLCKSMITNYFPVTINDKGYSQLKDFNAGNISRDSLVVNIVQFYKAFSNILEDIGGQVEKNSLENIAIWREKEPWFSEFIRGRSSEEFNKYMTTQDFKNRVAYFKTIACSNYLTILKSYKGNAQEVLTLINERFAEQETTP